MEQSGTLYARLVRATGLKSIDSDGQSDPYVRLSLGEWTHRSKTCKKTNDPVWEETFTFKGTLRALLAEPLQLQVIADGWPLIAATRCVMTSDCSYAVRDDLGLQLRGA